MSGPDLELTSDPGVVWRVGFRPDPWAWTDWLHATDEGRFNGRWDDQGAEFRTIYSGQSLLACLLEVLAHFRPDPVAEAALEEIEDPDGQIEIYSDAPSGTVGYSWLEQRTAGRANQYGRYCYVTHSKSIAALRVGFPFARFELPGQLFDAGDLKDAKQRDLTRSIARWLYDLRDPDRGDLVDGVEFRSRYGDDLRMWAVFERLQDEHNRTSRHIHDDVLVDLHPETPEIREAFELHGLRWDD